VDLVLAADGVRHRAAAVAAFFESAAGLAFAAPVRKGFVKQLMAVFLKEG
jgi:hypothetical protein